MTIAPVDKYCSPTYKHLIEWSVVHCIGNGTFLFRGKNLAKMPPFTGRRLRKPGPFIQVSRLLFGFVRESMSSLVKRLADKELY